MDGKAFGQPQLFHVKRLRLGHRSDHRMKRLAFRERMDAMHAAGEFYDFIAGLQCALILKHQRTPDQVNLTGSFNLWDWQRAYSMLVRLERWGVFSEKRSCSSKVIKN